MAQCNMDFQLSCSYKQCSYNREITTCKSDRVEVKTFVPNTDQLKQQSINFIVDWGASGDAIFHAKCWGEAFNKAVSLEKHMLVEAAKTAEFHLGLEKLVSKARRIAGMIKNSRFCIAFTGAGISTSAGIGDFRGKSGKWTENDRSKSYGSSAKPDSGTSFRYEDLRPTYTHEALAKLLEMGFIKHVISQNCDGLHALSGIPRDKLWELHGNVFQERCPRCGSRYDHPHAVRAGVGVGWQIPKPCPKCHCYHMTGNRCAACSEYLMDTVINFGDNLESDVLDGAWQVAQQNDLVLCLGTTLRVSPANSLVAAAKPTKLIICNRQETPCDEVCSNKGSDGHSLGCRVYGDCDPLMQEIMKNILGEVNCSIWENARKDRMEAYDSKRI